MGGRRTTAAAWPTAVAAMIVMAPLQAPADEPGPGLATSAWKLETLELRDGRRLEGLVVPVDPAAGDGDQDVRFMQVVRPPGRPMYVITWGPLPPDRVAAIDRLPAAEHERLAARVRAFLEGRQRRNEAETTVHLEREREDGPWRYRVADLDVTSSADAATTRSAIVTLEQVIGGLASLVPPMASAAAGPPIQVRLCGTAAEYRDEQRQLGISIDSPAFYVPARRLLVAGGDLPSLSSAAAAADDSLAAATQRYEELDRSLADRLKSLAADLERQGFTAAERSTIVQRARQRWERERGAELSRLAAARRDVATRLDAARRQFRERLAHEAWHAYADTRLRPADAAGLPLWLDEGLAQVVESAPFEAGELRLDAPDPRRLTALQQALRGGTLPKVADVIAAGQERFLDGHAGRDGARGLTYLAAWGVALDVAMLRPVLTPAAIVAMMRDEGDPLDRFEQLTGQPIDRYEAEWRRRILALRPGQMPEAEATVSPAR